MRYEIRPLGLWTDPVTEDRASSNRFRAPWSSTLDLLGYEVGLLDATLVVVQVDVTEGELRQDGMLRANAKVGFPGVRVSFDSRFGPLTYATDAYERTWSGGPPGWQANVRAIALALEALRAVDRYGVTRRGEQYRGWLPIEAVPVLMTADAAAQLIAEQAGGEWSAHLVLTDPKVRRRVYAKAVFLHHPDRGGDGEMFRRLTAARDLLDATEGNRDAH